MSAGRLCSRSVATAWPTESIRTAARRMAENEVGTLVVMEADGLSRALGIVTDRDITVRCVAANLDPDQTEIAKVMTTPVESVIETTPIEDAISRMASAATRRLVVAGKDGRLVGILSLDDVLDLLSEEIQPIARLLEKQRPHLPG